jgi:phosphatidylethanolamine/phosphatidyl-N-methylethanolamine N-methyltransferase
MLSKLDIKGAESALFFRHWLRHPLEIGAFLPSSAAIGRAMAKAVAFDRPGMVLELGGGTGAVTASLLDTGCAPDRLIVVEREPALAATLRRRFKKPEIVQRSGSRRGTGA